MHTKALAKLWKNRNPKPYSSRNFDLAAPQKINNPRAVMKRYLPLTLIVVLFIAFRFIGAALPDSQPNFQPLAALFFCGALLAPGWRGFAIPFGVWAITYPFAVGPVENLSILLTTILGLVVMFSIGQLFTKSKLSVLLLGSVASALAFHLITNGIAWLGDPLYAKNLTGLWQSLWTGPTGSVLPSWIFLRNLAAANLLFTGIFACAQLKLPQFSLATRRPIFSK
jgi:hypothetical protein